MKECDWDEHSNVADYEVGWYVIWNDFGCEICLAKYDSFNDAVVMLTKLMLVGGDEATPHIVKIHSYIASLTKNDVEIPEPRIKFVRFNGEQDCMLTSESEMNGCVERGHKYVKDNL